MRHAKLWSFIAAVLVTAANAVAVTYVVPEDRKLANEATAIVVGRTINVASRLTEDGRIETVVAFEIERSLKGALQKGKHIEIVQPGGRIENRFALIVGAPHWRVGQASLLFLEPTVNREWRTRDWGIGKFDIEGEEKLAIRDASSSLLLTEAGGVTRDEARSLSRFEAFIRACVNGTEASADYFTQSAPVANAGKIASNYTADDYLFYDFGGVKARWAGTTPFRPSTGSNSAQTGVTPAASLSAASAGADAWNSNSAGTVNLLVDGTQAAHTPFNGSPVNSDDINSLVFSATAPADFPGTEGGVAAYTGVYGDVGVITEADVFVSAALSGTNVTLFNEVMTHELGHALGFRHSNQGTPFSNQAVMNSSLSGAYGANLQCWDLEALRTVYGGPPACSAAPTITQQPQSQTVPTGSGANLSVGATGGCVFTYQWYRGTSGDLSNPIAGGTGPSLNTGALSVTTDFWVKVTNDCGDTYSSTATVTVTGTSCDEISIFEHPRSQTIVSGSSVTLTVSHSGSAPFTYQWYRGDHNTGTPINGATNSSYNTGPLTANASFWVLVTNACDTSDSNVAVITVTAGCTPPAITAQPQSVSITTGQTATLSVAATGTGLQYQWFRGNSGDTTQPISGATAASYTTPALNATTSYWVRVSNTCGQVASATATVTVGTVCTAPTAPIVEAPASVASGQSYEVEFEVPSAITHFEVQEATNDAFTNATTQVTQARKLTFTKNAAQPTRYFYRARAFAACNGSAGPYSTTAQVSITPAPSANDLDPNAAVPEGSTRPVSFTYHLNASGGTFNASTDKSWLNVSPRSGSIPQGGLTLTIEANPAGLPGGTNTGTLVVSTSGTSKNAERIIPMADGTTSTPLSVSLVTPVAQQPKAAANNNALVIPVVGHAAGGNNSKFLSDVRLLNRSNQMVTYKVTFTPTGTNGSSSKQTTISVSGQETKALNDIVQSWFGLGNLPNESALGVLEIRPTNLPGNATDLATAASSRTYNITPNGTFGQFIPAIPLTSFITAPAGGTTEKISLQQISQSATNSDGYRTNFGIVEGAGAAVNVIVRIYSSTGALLKEVPISLQPFEHRQINQFLVVNGVPSLADGRIEVQVQSGTGRVTAYASVLDNKTNDPLLVLPVVAQEISSRRYTLPGVAEFNNAAASWRTDLRIFNGGASSTTATVMFQPFRSGNTLPPAVTKQVTVPAGRVVAYDNVLQSLFGVTNVLGGIHVTTSANSSLVVTGRTYDLKPAGTYGQFIPAVSPQEGTGLGERSLEILQVEESDRFRTNVGIAELSGAPVVVEVEAHAPDMLAFPKKEIALAANEFIQINQILKNYFTGLGTSYNARLRIRVVGGTGRVTGYASVVDNKTQDPTYVPAQ